MIRKGDVVRQPPGTEPSTEEGGGLGWAEAGIGGVPGVQTFCMFSVVAENG